MPTSVVIGSVVTGRPEQSVSI